MLAYHGWPFLCSEWCKVPFVWHARSDCLSSSCSAWPCLTFNSSAPYICYSLGSAGMQAIQSMQRSCSQPFFPRITHMWLGVAVYCHHVSFCLESPVKGLLSLTVFSSLCSWTPSSSRFDAFWSFRCGLLRDRNDYTVLLAPLRLFFHGESTSMTSGGLSLMGDTWPGYDECLCMYPLHASVLFITFWKSAGSIALSGIASRELPPV